MTRAEYEDSDGRHTVGVASLLRGVGDWFLVADVSTDDVPVPVAGLVRRLQALALTIAVTAVLGIIALVIPATRPIANLNTRRVPIR